ncbi:Amidohydrolase subfamily protein [Nostocoides japonicum T1-X7]|uniref:Amidohydrolase subfamily protein n=1 Tax=Nostocoides japonicum T1-X7 TaxID=1194083 RepID=A0A077LVJ7_9MICO|nr:amidohydrolase [Tetrasphaera japonica]CCH76842.1 Amidohydrolase subfamily protein [Tetrasphaera japonica T1-X7]
MNVADGLLDALEQQVVQVTDDMVAWRHHLHAHPELSNREEQTAAFVADRLRGAGLDEVRTGIAGHGVVGVLRGGLPGSRVAALRADMDALPVLEESAVGFASKVVDEAYPGGPFPVAHACGHDCHMATALAAAHVLAAVRDRLPGTVLFVFQPAEEGPPGDEPGGARAMLDAGAFDDPVPTMVFGRHVSPLPRGVVGYRAGHQYAASCRVRITVEGRQTHGSTPWLGIDPLPAAAEIIAATGQIYRQVPAYNPITVSIGHVEDQGRFNIVGERVTLWGTTRCIEPGDMATVQANLRRLAEHHAAAYGCTATVVFDQDVPPVDNTEEWLARVLPAVRRVVGRDRVVEVPPTLGYDDVSVFTAAFGGVYLIYGVQDTEVVGSEIVPLPDGRGIAPNHSPRFYADDAALVDCLRIHVRVLAEHLHAQEG